MKWPATRRRSAARGVFIILPAPRAGGALIIISVTASALSPVRVPTGRAASDDGWAAADACACACAEVLVATTLPSRRRLAEAARAPQAIDEDARRPGVDCTNGDAPDYEPGSGTYEAGCADALSVADLKGAYYPRADARTGGATVDVTLLRNGSVNQDYDP